MCSLSSCAMRRRGSPPARWQVLGKGGPLAPSTQTCSQNRINRGHYPHRSSTPVCTLFYPNRIIIISEGIAKKDKDFWKKKPEKNRKKDKRGLEKDGEQKEKEKNIPRRKKIGPARLAAQLPHDFDLRNIYR